MDCEQWDVRHSQRFIYLKDFCGKAQSGALLSTGSLKHVNITLPFVTIITHYVRCKNCASFSFRCLLFFGGAVIIIMYP